MMFAEFRVYVQLDKAPSDLAAKMEDFIRACIGNLDGVAAVEVEPPKGSARTAADRAADRVPPSRGATPQMM